MADTPTGETVTPEALENKVTPVAAPVANVIDPAEVERLKKEVEQANLRNRQLQNEADARKKAEDERVAKELESQNEYKLLHEQEKARREELEAEKAANEKQKEINQASAEVLKDYTDEVKALAKDLGVTLSDDSDEAVADFKTKLDAAAKRVGTQKVTPNNPGTATPDGRVSGDALRLILANPQKRDAYMREHYPTTAGMMGPAK